MKTESIENKIQSRESFILETVKEISPVRIYHKLIDNKMEKYQVEFEYSKNGSWVLREPFVPKGRLIVLGAGHVGKELAALAGPLGFECIVADDRPEFASPSNIPFAKVLCLPFQEAIESLHITSRDYVCIMTRGHAADFDCLIQVLKGEMPAYLGQIGSKRKMALFFEDLRSMEFDEKTISSIHAPIGLDIQARTPAEIAVSIAAQLIQVRAQKEGKSRSDLDLEMMHPSLLGNSLACLTIVADSGSCPRKTGSKMFVNEAGKTLGTIGGGKSEAMMLEKARSLIGTGQAHLETIAMDNTTAQKQGMVCGGTITVLAEDWSEVQKGK